MIKVWHLLVLKQGAALVVVVVVEELAWRRQRRRRSKPARRVEAGEGHDQPAQARQARQFEPIVEGADRRKEEMARCGKKRLPHRLTDARGRSAGQPAHAREDQIVGAIRNVRAPQVLPQAVVRPSKMEDLPGIDCAIYKQVRRIA